MITTTDNNKTEEKSDLEIMTSLGREITGINHELQELNKNMFELRRLLSNRLGI